MKQDERFSFKNCDVILYPDWQVVETWFRDGTMARGTREGNMDNLVYAQHLGYSDCWRCLVEHELLHTYLSEALGYRWSPTLWAVAHDFQQPCAWYEEQLYEEAMVLAFQYRLHTGKNLPALFGLPQNIRSLIVDFRNLTDHLW